MSTNSSRRHPAPFFPRRLNPAARQNFAAHASRFCTGMIGSSVIQKGGAGANCRSSSGSQTVDDRIVTVAFFESSAMVFEHIQRGPIVRNPVRIGDRLRHCDRLTSSQRHWSSRPGKAGTRSSLSQDTGSSALVEVRPRGADFPYKRRMRPVAGLFFSGGRRMPFIHRLSGNEGFFHFPSWSPARNPYPFTGKTRIWHSHPHVVVLQTAAALRLPLRSISRGRRRIAVAAGDPCNTTTRLPECGLSHATAGSLEETAASVTVITRQEIEEPS